VRVPYFYTDQYDLSMEYYGYTGREGHDRVVFRGEPVGGGEWLAFWLRDGRVRAAMNVNVWDQSDALKKLTRDQTEVDPDALADASVDLGGLAGSDG
jgi:3-phenylpropionate/trans-cinnamate dioxygenase ferredoxin reductase subunit